MLCLELLSISKGLWWFFVCVCNRSMGYSKRALQFMQQSLGKSAANEMQQSEIFRVMYYSLSGVDLVY